MLDAAIAGRYLGMFIQGEDIAQSDPNVQHVKAALGSLQLLVVQDLFLNETAKFAHVFLPGTSFLEKDGTFTNAERRINRVRPVMAPKSGKHEWEAACELATAMGYPMAYAHTSEIMDEIAATTPTFAGVSFDRLDAEGSVQWPCNDAAPDGTPIMHVDGFVRGKGHFVETPYVPTDERTNRKFPLILTTGRILSQYNVGAQTRRTENIRWHSEDVVEVHPHDAETRGITTGQAVTITSRVGETVLRAKVTDRVPQGVVYTTFHYPGSGANVVTTEYSDWATNCPEYKVTAVELAPTSRAPVTDAEMDAEHRAVSGRS
jgi:formate dehydrogenase major subunit